MRRLILRSFQSPGDVLMLTAAVRDLHAAHPGKFQTDVRTSADAIWQNNPHLTQLAEGAAGVETIDRRLTSRPAFGKNCYERCTVTVGSKWEGKVVSARDKNIRVNRG